jgi:hypothetical protein
MRAGQLQSPAVIGLCKALEAEVVERLLVPLREQRDQLDFDQDAMDVRARSSRPPW